MSDKLKVFSKYYLTFTIYGLIGWIYEVLWMWFVVPPRMFINRGVLFGPVLPIYGFGMLLLLFLLNGILKKKHTVDNKFYLILSAIIVTTFIYTTAVEYTVSPKIYSVVNYLKNYGIGLVVVNVAVIVLVYIIEDKTKNEKIKNLDLTIVLVFLLIWIITTVIEYISHLVIDKCFHKMLWDYTYDFLNVNKRINWDASRNFAVGGTFLIYVVQPQVEKLLGKIKEKNKIILAVVIGIIMLADFVINVILK
jgi:uncharacterized membrane protein